jgi:hypothetical protein
MNPESLIATAEALVAPGKGLLAMDESNGTCNKRFAAADIAQTVEMRRAYRELLLTTPGLSECIRGVILADEAIRQAQADGTPLVRVARDAGLTVGTKVDTGAKDLAGHPCEQVTEGLDGLRERLAAYFALGARFAKWRTVPSSCRTLHSISKSIVKAALRCPSAKTAASSSGCSVRLQPSPSASTSPKPKIACQPALVQVQAPVATVANTPCGDDSLSVRNRLSLATKASNSRSGAESSTSSLWRARRRSDSSKGRGAVSMDRQIPRRCMGFGALPLA